MVGYLAEAGLTISFVEWMKYGLPLAPVLAVTVGAYMYVRDQVEFAGQARGSWSAGFQ